MSADPTPLEISYEAIEQAQMPLSQYMAQSDTLDAASDALRVAAPLIVAAELERLVDETDWAWAVGESLRRRAAELRGDRKAGA